MKKTLLFLGALALGLGANAQTEKELTTNSSMNFAQGSILCHWGETFEEVFGVNIPVADANNYYKKFELSNLGVNDTFHVTSLDFGVYWFQGLEDYFEEDLPIVETHVPVIIDLYKTSVNTFPATWGGADYEFVGNTIYNVSAADDEQMVTAHFEDPITFEADEIVIASIANQDLLQLDEEGYILGGNILFLAFNSDGDSETTYLKAEPCGLDNPTAVGNNGADGLIVKLRGTEGFLSVEDVVFEGFKQFTSNNTLHISNDTAIQTVEIYNVLGQKVIANNANASNVSIDLGNLTNGVYITKVTVDGIEKTFKIIK